MAAHNPRTPLLKDDGHGMSSYSEVSASEDEVHAPAGRSHIQQQQNNDGEAGPSTARRQEKLTCFVYALTFLSAIGGFLFGYDTGVVSGAMILLKDEFHLNVVWQELVVSVTIGAAALFAIVGGFSNDRLGRKPTILIASFVFTVGAVVLGAAYNTIMLLCGRIIVGMGIGLASMSTPMYIAESAPPHMRGRLVTLNNVFITGGQFFASLVDGAFSYDKKNGWRYMLGVAGVPSVVQFIGFLFMPESPRWLVQKGKVDKALTTLQTIRGRKDVDQELNEVKESCDESARIQAEGGSYVLTRIVQTPHVRKALIVGCALQIFQQICGINTVMYYSATIIKMSGVKSASAAIWLASATAGTNFIFTFVGLYLVERIGRKSLTVGSLAGTMVSLALLAVGFQLAAVRSPPITVHGGVLNGSSCDTYSSCNSCIEDTSCGFCYLDLPPGPANGSCAPVATTDTNIAMFGRCTSQGLNNTTSVEWAYDYCPTDVSWMALVGLILYLAAFAPGMGPMPWTINSEIYPLWARSTGVSIATSANWVSNLIISMTFLTLTETLTRYGAFWLYTVFAFLGLLFIIRFLPETKGRSLEQVEQLFKKPWFKKSSGI